MNIERTDLIEGALIIHNEDGTITCISEEGCTNDEKAMFDEFRRVYPDGKPKPIVEPTTPVPTETELLKSELTLVTNKLDEQIKRNKAMEADNLAFQDFIIETVLGGM